MQGAEKFGAQVLYGVVARLREHATQWASTPAKERAELVDRVIHDTHSIAPSWNETACRAKGLDPEGHAAGEELLAGIEMFINGLHAYRQSLIDISHNGPTRFPGPHVSERG